MIYALTSREKITPPPSETEAKQPKNHWNTDRYRMENTKKNN